MKDHPSHWTQNKLTCHDVAEQVSHYLDHRLTFLTQIRIGLHVASCAHCHIYVKQLLLVRDVVAFLPRQYPSAINRLHLRRHFARCHPPRPMVS